MPFEPMMTGCSLRTQFTKNTTEDLNTPRTNATQKNQNDTLHLHFYYEEELDSRWQWVRIQRVVVIRTRTREV